ncbi:MAG: biotin--[acetyl-CoA-carboxylase] ligase [candidate division Zixibacteria bacterium RBG_16_50_21]|nr:MAG: biotin--[acetyl-CoA-carboxylase] ligase [candidate division Zixibacteria bacterium RBG_16_50_21]
MGKEIHCFQKLGSTNQVAFRLAESGAPEGTLVLAEKQTAGRGRLSRKWFSPPQLGIWLSLILRPRIPLAWVPALSLCACLACVRATNRFTDKKPAIKWPNDAYLNGKKFSGVLTELSAELDRVNFVVLGIGINVNHSSREFPGYLRKNATSLRIEAKKRIDRVSFLHKFLEEFESIYEEYKYSGLDKFKLEVSKNSYLLNKKVEVEIGDQKILGKAIDIDDYGALILDTKTGLKTITAGDVSVLPAKPWRL